MQVADALARQNKETEEFALYDQLLRELGAKASGVPIGGKEAARPAADNLPETGRLVRAQFGGPRTAPNPACARSVQYVQVLDRYVSRLASLNRPLDALRVYRGEVDRNPNDPGLYERLAVFLDQNGMAREVEQTYRRALAKFPDRSWYHKLARWYLRNRQRAALEKISREAVSTFSGSELEAYFSDVVSQAPEATLYRQLNVYAHERFPEDMVFVQNLLNAYSRRETFDSAAAERLLRQYWFYDLSLRDRLFTQLAQQGTLLNELAAVRNSDPAIASGNYAQALAANPAAVQFAVEAEAWLCHFEAAAPGARALALAYPGRREFTDKAASLYRSLAAYSPANTEIAAGLAELEQKANPRDPNRLARIGDIFAGRELFARARPYWERMPTAQAGKPEAYLDTATVYWDYYLYNDALRWLRAARTRFKDPTLYAYQAGAIYEGKRDYTRAVHEYLEGALDGNEQARGRLIRLSKRPATRNAVDQATAAALVNDSSWAALSVRIETLEAQQRRPDLESLLRARVEVEGAPAVLNDIEEAARRQGFDEIEKRASERQAAVTNDPVDKMRLTLATARLYEFRKDLQGAAKIVDTLYRDNPLILGVVRGAVDFHVRNKQHEDAIRILLASAKQARSDLASEFTLEASRVATTAGRFEQARGLLTQLLGVDPYRPEYLSAVAGTYLAAKDDRGFRDYELATVQQLKGSPLTFQERIARIAAVRRALIPALDRLEDYGGAVAQYIELINSFPEVEALTREAAAYATAHHQVLQLTDFYRKTVEEAPRDYRWPAVLGRIETVAEDYPASIADYERALKARPDKPGVLEAKAQLEERLMRFEEAIKSYSRLYELTYRDPQWLVKVAELHARCNRPADSVSTLRGAIIGARSETAEGDFEIAQRLESWHILTDAVQYAERGAKLAASQLFDNSEQAKTYARIMAKARRLDSVLNQLVQARAGKSQQQGSIEYLALTAGTVVAELYTPDEKLQLEHSLTSIAAGMPRLNRDELLLPFAASGGLTDLESRWRYESMVASGLSVDQRFVTLQSERGLYGELGKQLEHYAAGTTSALESAALTQAAQAFVSEGDTDGQLRTMRALLNIDGLNGAFMDRYLSLLTNRRPDDLLALARRDDKAVQFAIANGQPRLAYPAIRNRGAAMPPVWTSAYTALAGVFFNDRTPGISAAFDNALDTRSIGERIQAPPDRNSTIAGHNWFYYGARYGEYLAMGKEARADVYLPARVEGAPGSPDAYLQSGDFYAEVGQSQRAVTQFDLALQLDANRGDADDHAARVLWAQGRQDEAITRWKAALAAHLRVESRGVRVPEQFWARVGETFTDIGERKALPHLLGDIERLLADYIHRNGGYRLHELLEPAARASFASGQDLNWLLALNDPANTGVFRELQRLPDLTPAQRIALQRYRVASEERGAASSHGDDRNYHQEQLNSARSRLVSMLLDAGDIADASEQWNLIPEQARTRNDTGTEIRLASRSGTLEQLLNRYRANPETAPSANLLREAAVELKRHREEESARTVLVFLYEREIAGSHLEAANFLGLAGVKLERKETAAALALLNRMALVADDAFDTLVPAADVLTRFGSTSDAATFLRRRVTAVPWDSEAKLRLAKAQAGQERQGFLSAVAADGQAPYKLRLEAAEGSRKPIGVPGTELALLAGAVTPASASKPYYVESRVVAARGATDPETRLRMWREALALTPDDERIRLGTIGAALSLKRDAFALSASRPAHNRPRSGYGDAVYDYGPPYQPWNWSQDSSLYAWRTLDDAGRSALAASLGEAGERTDELALAHDYLRHAIYNAPADKRVAIEKMLHALEIEQDRRAKNAARQPVVRGVIDQDQVVRPRIPGGIQ
jgi:hypothetical protein